MKIQAIDHVAVVVDDLRDAVALLQETFGLDPVDRIEREDLTAVFLACGSMKIELIEITDADARRTRLGDAPARIEHIAFVVSDLDDALHELGTAGIRPTDLPRASGGRRTVWTEPSTSDGVMYQFVELQ